MLPCGFSSLPVLVFLNRFLPRAPPSAWPLRLVLGVSFSSSALLIRTVLGIPLLHCQGTTLRFSPIFRHKVHTSRLSSCALFPTKWFRTSFYDLALLTFTFEVPLPSPRRRETCGMFLTTRLISVEMPFGFFPRYAGSCGLGFFMTACCRQDWEPGRELLPALP